MSSTIDNRVVQMQFDNRHFEENVATSLSTLDKLKRSLNMDGAAKGFDSINKAVKNVDMNGLGQAIDQVSVKFSKMYSVADQMVRNITTRVQNAAERMAKALTVDPITTGLNEYETKMNAIQVIQANTRGKNTMEDITAALEELNTYADKTIYNFAQMTSNVGKFTAQGYDVKEATQAVKGLANLAAASGASPEDMARATYQMSQALGGTIRLMDWNSLRNANMATTELKNTLTALAKVKGIDIDSMIAEKGTFEQTLSEGWLTGDMFTEAMNIYSGLYSEAELKAKGFTDSQIKNFMELAKMAESAATEVKTFTQLWDVLKETAQSGWTQTWELLIGDFDTAKKMLTDLQKYFSNILNGWAEVRNEMLKGWSKAGGRQDLIDSIVNVYHGIVSIIKPIKEAFSEIFPPLTVDRLVAFTTNLKKCTEWFRNAVAEGTKFSDRIKRIAKGAFAVADIVVEFGKAAWNAFKEVVDILTPAGDGIFGFAASLSDALVTLRDWIKSGDIFGRIFEKIVNVIRVVVGWISKFISFIKSGFRDFSVFGISISGIVDRVKDRFQQLAKIGEKFKKSASEVNDKTQATAETMETLKAILSKVKEAFVILAKGIGDAFKRLFGEADFNTFLDIANGGILGALLIMLTAFVKKLHSITNKGDGLLDFIKKFINSLANGGKLKSIVKEVFEPVKEALVSWQNSLKAQTLMTIAKAIGILTISLFALSLLDSAKLGVALAAITGLFIDLFGAMALFQKVIGPKGVMEFGKLGSVMIAMSVAVLILSFAMAKFAKLDWNGVAKGLVGVAGLSSILLGFSAMLGFLSKRLITTEKQTKRMGSVVLQLIGMAIAIRILASACKVMGQLSWEELVRGLVGMAVALGALTLALKFMPKTSALSASGLIVAAGALILLAGALKVLGLLKMEEIGRALVAIGGGLGLLAAGLHVMKGTAAGSVALLVSTVALIALAGALKLLGLLKWDEIGKALVAIGGCLAILAAGLFAMSYTLVGSAALVVASAALATIVPILKILGSMSWESIAKGLVALAGSFAVIGIAAAVLAPVIPTLLALSIAIALLGVSWLAIGAGLALVATGITAVAAAVSLGAAAIVAGLTTILTGIIKLIPTLAIALATGLVDFIKTLAALAPALFDAVKSLVLGLLDVLLQCVPRIVDVLLKLIVLLLEKLVEYTPTIVGYVFDFLIGLIDGIAERLPDLIQSAVNLLMAFFNGIVDALKGIDTSALLQGIVGIGLLSLIMGALAAVAALVPGAMIGILGVGLVIAEMALVLAAVGALAQLPGLNWLINEGGEMLKNIGRAIGGFVGGIVGGIAEGITGSLPQIATDLSNFMTNLQPFIEGAKSVDSAMMDGVKAIAETILLLTGANLLEKLTSWITGGSSLAEFGSQLGTLGTDMNTFATNLGTFDESKVATVTCAANALKNLAMAAEAIPNEGGWVSKLVGENSLAAFGGYLPGLGTNLALFAANLGTFDESKATTVTCAANAIKNLAEAADAIPNEGGWVSKLVGENSLATFGSYLPDLGTNLGAFATNLGSFDESKVTTVTCAANAIKAMADAASSIDGQADWAKKIFGDNSLSAFGAELASLGTDLATFAGNLGTFSEDKVATVKSAVQAIKALADLADADLKGAKKNLEGFGDKLGDFATDLAGFCDDMPSGENITSATTSLKNIVSALKDISGTDSGSISKLSKALKELGESGVESFIKEFTSNTAKANVKAAAEGLMDSAIKGVDGRKANLKKSITSAVSAMTAAIKDAYQGFYNAGTYLVDGFAAGISANTYKAEAKAKAMAKAAADAAEKALDINSPSKVFRAIGTAVPEGFAQGIGMLGKSVSDAAVAMTDGATSSVSKAVSGISDMVSNDIDAQPTIRPVLDLTDVRNGAKSIGGMFNGNSVGVLASVGAISSSMNGRNQNGANSDVVSAINKLRKDLENVKGDTYSFGNIAYGDDSEVQDAVRTLVRAVKIGRRA